LIQPKCEIALPSDISPKQGKIILLIDRKNFSGLLFTSVRLNDDRSAALDDMITRDDVALLRDKKSAAATDQI
jgi:hypothetical protein